MPPSIVEMHQPPPHSSSNKSFDGFALGATARAPLPALMPTSGGVGGVAGGGDGAGARHAAIDAQYDSWATSFSSHVETVSKAE